MTTGEVLKAARALVEKRWMQGGYSNADRSSFCSVGAIMRVSCGLPRDAEQGAVQTLAKAVPTNDLIGWNDAPYRTQAEVLAAFDKAIAEVGP